MLNPLSTQLDSYLTLVSQRQKLVAANIANADTPNYQTKDFDFESSLHAALMPSGSPIASGPPLIADVPGLRVKNDGNNVDLDREARLLAENAMRFNVASNLLRVQLKDLHLAISGGSGA